MPRCRWRSVRARPATRTPRPRSATPPSGRSDSSDRAQKKFRAIAARLGELDAFDLAAIARHAYLTDAGARWLVDRGDRRQLDAPVRQWLLHRDQVRLA